MGASLNNSLYKEISVSDIEKGLLNDPMVQLYLHERKMEEMAYGEQEYSYEEDIGNNDTATNEISFDEEDLIKLCEDMLSQEEIESADGDYKTQLLLLGKKMYTIAMTEGTGHGLFGKLHGKYGDIEDLDGAMNYVEQKTKEGTVMFHSLISFSPEDASSLGLNNSKAMKNLLREKIFIISDMLDIPPSRLEYAGAVHLKKSNPHVHFIFWDKAQEVQNTFVHPKVSSKIRDKLINSVYKEERNELFQIKNAARDILTKGIGIKYADVATYFLNLSDDEYMKEKKKANSIIGRLFNTRLDPSLVDELGKDYLKIIDNLPSKGRLSYQFLKPDVKEMVDKVIYKLINENEEFKNEYNVFLHTAKELASMHSKNPERLEQAREKAEKDILKRMGNSLIETMKDVKKHDSLVARDNAYKRQLSLDITTGLFQILRNINNNNRRSNDIRRGELSKEAKKELMKKHESASSIDWERD